MPHAPAIAMRLSCIALLLAGTVACAQGAASGSGTGPSPTLPEPSKRLIPRVDIAPARGWPQGRMPVPAQGHAVVPFATGLAHPRWLHVLPNGDVLVAESNAPEGSSGMRGIKRVAMKVVMKRAGAGVPSADRITLLRDTDGDGRADVRHVFASNLRSPFGMALVGGTLYVANADALVAFDYRDGMTQATGAPRTVVTLPGADGLNHHWTKSLLASKDGTRLYVGVGSNSNVAENGMAAEAERAAVLEIDPVAKTRTVYASGLRNPVGIDWGPDGALWAVVNERDELGDDLVPDYLARVERGAFYGWPYSYWGQHVDARVSPPRPDLVAKARVPDYGLGNHVAPLGLAFNRSQALAAWGEGAFVGLHGSWNRKPLSGYKVVFVPFLAGKPQGAMRDVLTGFLNDIGNAHGRPVGVAIAKDGGLLVADDVGNAIWRVMPAR